MFSQQRHLFFFKNIRKNGPIFFLALLFCVIAGCGAEDVDPCYYNPVSPLPLRIDVTPTPTVSAANENAEQNTPTPFSDTLQFLETPIPVTEDDTEEVLESSYTPTPVSTPVKEVPAPSPTPTITKATPTPIPVVTPIKPTATPQAEKLEKAEASKDSSRQKTTSAKQPDEQSSGEQTEQTEQIEQSDEQSSGEQTEQPDEQGSVTQEEEKFVPIVTADFIIDGLAVCSKISDREPVNCGDEFSLSKVGKIYTWMKVSGVKPSKAVKHVYYWEGAVIATVKLKLKYTSMRTWSQKTFKPLQALGKWKVVITTEEDEVITVKEFTVVR